MWSGPPPGTHTVDHVGVDRQRGEPDQHVPDGVIQVAVERCTVSGVRILVNACVWEGSRRPAAGLLATASTAA